MKQRLVFDHETDFEAMRSAEKWCADNGFSVGSGQRGAPRGILKGEFAISKWRGMNRAEIAALHGKMIGDMRTGPVVVEIF